MANSLDRYVALAEQLASGVNPDQERIDRRRRKEAHIQSRNHLFEERGIERRNLSKKSRRAFERQWRLENDV